ncbi:MAG: amidophosphoribosyltransferase [Candidatus Omnitrophota bacterium]|nr:amidophosphoribosyltransferase [Candidatus Omnitrophota bacterium]
MPDNCGVFGVYSKRDCVNDIYLGIDFLQHRGQQYCGIATAADNEISLITHLGRVGERFTELELRSLSGNFGIGHVSLKDRQPVKLETKLGSFAACFSGNIINADQLFLDLKKKGHSFSTDSHIELLSKMIGEGEDLVQGIVSMAQRIKGAFSLLILNHRGIYAARGPYGFRPLILGSGNEKFVVASESRAVESLDMEIERDVKPGEIILINKHGFNIVGKIPVKRTAHCAFEWAYVASIDSKIDGVYVKQARNNLGEKLAERDEREGRLRADCIASVPMSGIGHALGYHKRSKIQYQNVFLYNRYADRSYTLATQAARDKMAKRKLSVIREAVQDKKIILCDDSIVRGTQIRDKVRELKKAGAKEVHVRVACPPLMHPCSYGISTRTYEELAVRSFIKQGEIGSLDKLRIVEEKVAKLVGADSLKYNSLEDFVSAIGLPKEKLCLNCWDGIRPIEEK